jgi:acetylornithine deacetylase/succinyl-diaminopimelate desuccinylase-like protein
VTLSLSAALLAACACAVSGPLPPPADLATARGILTELVEINSTHAYGSTAIAQAVAARLIGAGFAAVDVQVLVPGAHPSKGNVVARLRGARPERYKPLLYIGHLDVVEARREDWSVDPFKLTEKDGFYYGRGTSDMKGDAATVLSALIRLKRQGFVPRRDIVVALTADEEIGGDANGVDWLLTNHRDLVDAAFVINLDSGQPAIRDGRRLYTGVQTSEKGYLSFALQVLNKGGHSSIPESDNAIYRMSSDLLRISTLQFPVRLTETTRAYFAQLAHLQADVASADMLAVTREPPDEQAARRLSANPLHNAQLRTTCIPTRLVAGEAENALPQRARAIVQCRLLPGDTPNSVRSALVDALSDPQVSVEISTPMHVVEASPLDPDLVNALQHVTTTMWPGLPVVPIMETGGTDGSKTRAAGLPTYGISGIFRDIDDDREHGRDERIDVNCFAEGVEFAYRLMKELSGLAK